uniref:Non-homologous end-joining factor 1 n=1 Tax=Callorhinchus milii TaxID=7868 RepID=A0A4W3J323_CALMI
MSRAEGISDDLLPQPWVSVCVGDAAFLLKACFREASYTLMLSDLVSVWWEEMTSDNIRQRSQVSLSSLYTVCPHSQVRVTDTVTLLYTVLRSELSGVPFYWAFHCSEAPISMVRTHLNTTPSHPVAVHIARLFAHKIHSHYTLQVESCSSVVRALAL